MVNYGGYCGRLYGAVESSMWIALQWPGRNLRGSVESICTMCIAIVTRSGLARLLRCVWNQSQESIHSAAASHDHAVDIPEEAVPVAIPSESASNENHIVQVAPPSESASCGQALVPVVPPLESASHERALVLVATPSESASHERALVPVTAPSESASNEQALVPVVPPLESASHERALVPVATPLESASHEQALVPVASPSESASNDQVNVPVAPLSRAISEATNSGWVITQSIETPFDVFANRCRSILDWLVDKFEAACFYRNWSYEVVGITSNQEDATALDCVLTAISRWNVKKRIEKVEITVSEVKKSPLLGVTSKSTPDDIANQNRSRIRSDSNHMVFGREALRDSIMAELRETPDDDDAPRLSTSPCYSVIGIYGIAGSGKTTFARYIRDYVKEEEEELFDTIICIHVSETFSVDDIFREMLKDITKNRHSNISDREELEEKLKESLCSKRFFMILDDLWVKTKSDSQLKELIAPLDVGLRGSKILVTARTKVAAGALCANEPIEMPNLDNDEYLSMFMHYALGGTSVTDEEFTKVGRVITKKLHGSPIAAVIVAGRLGANQCIRFWENTAECDMLNDTMDCLWWSYQQLSSDIRRCFEYCNIFPRRFRIEKDYLVHLLIAQEFVNTNCAGQDMEDVAESFIGELVSYSFLQREYLFGVCRFTIHDLLHDLADMVTRTDFFRIKHDSSQRREDWNEDVSRDVRHLFVQYYDANLITEKILVLENLRTIIIYYVGADTPVEETVIESICKRLLKLRVLAIGSGVHSLIEERKNFLVPQSIGRLKHLRHLSLRINRSGMVILPDALAKLQHIQLLDFDDAKISNFNLGELRNLRHIFCHSGVKLANISKLTLLRTLLCDLEVRNEQGYEVNQLMNLNNIRGVIEIHGLENVKNKEEACGAKLAAKKRLTTLALKWHFYGYRRCSPELEAEILESMCPHKGLEVLYIYSYRGSRYPNWMVSNHNGGPKNLRRILFYYCNQRGPGPELVEAFPHLCELDINHCSWHALPGNMQHPTSLRHLTIFDCLNIQSLPILPLFLAELYIMKCNAEFMLSCQTIGDPNWHKVEHIPWKVFDPSVSGEETEDEVSDDYDEEEPDDSDGIAA